MDWSLVSNAASVATLILFIIYFIGRAITVHQERALYFDKLDIRRAQDRKYNSDDDAVEEWTLEENPYNVFTLTSAQGIWNLKVYQYELDKEWNIIGEKKIRDYPFLNVGQSIAFYLTLPEIMPKYRVEYITVDFKKVQFELRDNMKNGVLSEIATPKHTVKSVMYYMFR